MLEEGAWYSSLKTGSFASESVPGGPSGNLLPGGSFDPLMNHLRTMKRQTLST
jgi:hypothetical protein